MDPVEKRLVEMEQQQWERLGKDPEVERDFAEGFLSVGAWGVRTREEALGEFLKGDLAILDFRLTDFRVIRPTEDTALLLYTADATYSAKGERLPYHVFATALWVRRQSKWEKVFYQSTPVREG